MKIRRFGVEWAWGELTRLQIYTLLYKVLVRAKLEFGVIIYYQDTITNKVKIESIQKFFIRILCYKFGLPYYNYRYEYWCNFLGLEPLYSRRENIDKQFIDDILSNKISSSFLLWNIGIQVLTHNFRNYKFLINMERNKNILARMIHNYNYSEKKNDRTWLWK